MRSILFTILFFQSVLGSAQENNPYNSRGLDYVSSLAIIKKDFDGGKVRDITEQTLAYYSRLVPSENAITADVAAKIVQTIKNNSFDFEEFISAAEIPSFSKETYLNAYRQSFTLKGEEFADFLRHEVDAISQADIDQVEKESLLTFVALIYNGQAARRGCTTTITGPNGVMVDDSGTGCIILGIGVGLVVGNLVCGIPCAIGGAIVGGIVGALT